MGWPEVQAFFDALPLLLAAAATVIVYGPFNYDGAYTSDSTRSFDASLRARDPCIGIRDFAVDALARAIGVRLTDGSRCWPTIAAWCGDRSRPQQPGRSDFSRELPQGRADIVKLATEVAPTKSFG